MLRDDGAAVWLNGREVFRSNLPAIGLLSPTTFALANVGNADEQTYFPYSNSGDLLVPGTNFLAVEVHQMAGNRSNLGFDLQLIAAGYRTDIRPPALSLEATAQGPLLPRPSAATGWRLEVSTDPGATTSWQEAGLPFRLVDEWREVQAS